MEKSITNGSKISADKDSIGNVMRHDLEVVELNSQRQIPTGGKFSPKIVTSFDTNFEQTFDEKLKLTGKFTKATQRSAELLKTYEEGNASLSIKNTADSNSNRTVGNDCNISSKQSNNFEQVVRPIMSKPILLKKYDHIVSSAINNENLKKEKKQFNQFVST